MVAAGKIVTEKQEKNSNKNNLFFSVDFVLYKLVIFSWF
jgi:hypothetical protein